MFTLFPGDGYTAPKLNRKQRFKRWFNLRVRCWLNPRYVWGWLWNLPWQPKNYVMRDLQTPSERRRITLVHEFSCKERAEAHETLDKLYAEVIAARPDNNSPRETQDALTNIVKDMP